jgi:hypothetical protein
MLKILLPRSGGCASEDEATDGPTSETAYTRNGTKHPSPCFRNLLSCVSNVSFIINDTVASSRTRASRGRRPIVHKVHIFVVSESTFHHSTHSLY